MNCACNVTTEAALKPQNHFIAAFEKRQTKKGLLSFVCLPTPPLQS